MNPCVFTGARVLIEPYNKVVSADLFEVENCTIVRANMLGIRDHSALGTEPTHVLHDPKTVGHWWREDLGIFVVPNEFLVGERRR